MLYIWGQEKEKGGGMEGKGREKKIDVRNLEKRKSNKESRRCNENGSGCVCVSVCVG